MIVFDTETTSLNSKSGQIAQLSYIKINENNNVEENKPTSLTKAQETELMFLDAQKLKDEKQYVKALEEYKSICDTLDFVSEEDLPTQVDIYTRKRDVMSEIIKNKINKL